ncbi:hypothetical protein LA05_01885 [Xanthomonas oryzae pv. oryzae]|uniref:hypothetical protein n=1 Tax=Xanthomonas oryzae TaxID=347 RepID=UPI000CA86BF4|nr:hypothetical protein [Xanthomonas oryzae]PNR90604.1 hypothetical protein LA05_01885 [Xanthomonas oryzae pv. oryzae]
MQLFFALLPGLILFWPLLKLIKKGWRLFAVLFFAALISGCASTSNKFNKSPCACKFENVNTDNYGSQSDA